MDASRGVEINLLGGWRRLGFISLCVFGLILGGSFGAILVCGRIVVFLLTGIRFVVGAALIILFIVDACAVIIAASSSSSLSSAPSSVVPSSSSSASISS
ncbi:hypothetical protein ELZ20_17055 [Brucella abortus]|nr:hypothetical protein ELZ20_17055 [Brucella abortus]